LFTISTYVVRAKRAGVSLFNVIFVLKEKGEITLLLTVYWKFHVITLNQWYSLKFVRSKICLCTCMYHIWMIILIFIACYFCCVQKNCVCHIMLRFYSSFLLTCHPFTFHILIFSFENLSQMNWNLVESIYGRSSLKSAHFVMIHYQIWLPQAILVSDWLIFKNLLLWNRMAKWTETW
jgi:hypothetical protein